MQKFIKQLMLHCSLFLIFVLGIILIPEKILNRIANFKLYKESRYIVVGHSHPECAFNDSIITGLVNLASSGESYFYTYFKLKQVIEQNPHIETVFVEFTNNQINESMDSRIYSEKYMNHRYGLYSPFMNKDDKILLANNNLKGLIKAQLRGTRNNIFRMVSNDYIDLIGGYLYLVRDKTDSLIINKDYNEIDKLKPISISYTNLNYLSKIVEFCIDNNKEIIFIRTPQHEQYTGYNNEKSYQKIRQEKYSEIMYLDFSKFPLLNSEFGDLEHLNHKGARKFSIWFEQLMKSGFLKKANKQAYINEEIKVLKKVQQ